MASKRNGRRHNYTEHRRLQVNVGTRQLAKTVCQVGLGSSLLSQPPNDELWKSLRQGARNIAGVRYQLAVTAHLLAESRAGALPFVELVPEGFEDIDCLDGEGNRWFVQVKEVGAGAGRFTAASVADAISHAAAAARTASRIVVITDAQLGGQVVETRWDQSITETVGYGAESTVQGLMSRGHRREDAEQLLARSHLIRLPWNTAPLTSMSIASAYGLKPAVAAMVESKLLEDLADVASDQRNTLVNSPKRRVLNDLDVLVNQILNIIDVNELDSAVRLGVCATADYSAVPGASRSDFLLGVDATPAHIGAQFDIIRPGPTRAVQVCLEQARYGLITGASGAGKSAQMWRSARDVAPGARVVRVHRLETDEDVRELVRFVQVLRPTTTSAVIVCCDDLGRPRTAMWPIAARRLLEQSSVLLIGAVRNEDFTAELLRYGGELVELSLDNDTAMAIASQLEYSGIVLTLEVPEAVRLAKGHLMEYIALLTIGKRLRSVLSAQAEALLQSEDEALATVTRIVCGAHVLGVGIDTSALVRAVGLDRAQLSKALRRLQDEHIITSGNGTTWCGLHQRRSDVLTEFLHQTPPPTLSETMTAVARSVPPAALGWCLRRMVELLPELPQATPNVVNEAISRCGSAIELAALLEGLERADHSLTAREYIPIIERYRTKKIPLLDLALLVCGDKIGDIQLGAVLDGSPLATVGRQIHRCAEDLPDRSITYCAMAAEKISGTCLTDLIVRASLEDAVRLIEAAALYIRISSNDLNRIAEAFPWPAGLMSFSGRRLQGRLIAACRVAYGNGTCFEDVFGSVSERVQLAAQSHPNAVSAVIVESQCGEAKLELLADMKEGTDSSGFIWDLESQRSDNNDSITKNAVDLATFVGECCPELEVVEVKTILADRSPLIVGDYEPGHKRLERRARPPRELVRVNVGIQAAISRQAAANTWTELIRLRSRVAMLIGDLIRDAPRRIDANDNQRRRSEWLKNLDIVDELLGQVPRPPVISELDTGSPAVMWDSQREEDKILVALRSIADTLRGLVTQAPVRLPVGSGNQARKSARKMREALTDSTALTTADERSTCEQLTENLDQLGDLLVAIAFDTCLSSMIRGTPDRFGTVITGLIENAATRQLERERYEIEREFGRIPGATVLHIPDEEPFITSISRHQWLIMVPPKSWEAVVLLARDLRWPLVDVPISVVCELDETLLFAARLSKMFGSGLVPLGLDTVVQFASKTNKRTLTGPILTLLGAVVQELVQASWECALLRLRPTPWQSRDVAPEAHRDEAQRLIDSSGPNCPPPLFEILEELIDRVTAELNGESLLAPVAAELAGVELNDPIDSDKSHAMTVVARAFLAALDLELQQARAN